MGGRWPHNSMASRPFVLPALHRSGIGQLIHQSAFGGRRSIARSGCGYGLAMWWNLKIVRPEPQPNKNTKDEVNKQKPNRIPSAETAADSDKMPKLTMSSRHIAKPHVSGLPLFYSGGYNKLLKSQLFQCVNHLTVILSLFEYFAVFI